jgi:hypothetical protein
MSKRINVNPDHYKVAGRERPDTLAAERTQRLPRQKDLKARARWERTRTNRRSGA